MSVYSNIIHRKNGKQSRMSFSGCMDKQTVVHPYMGILPNTEKEQTIDTHHTQTDLKNSEEAVFK